MLMLTVPPPPASSKLSKRAQGGAGCCALSRCLRPGTMRKARWDFALFRASSVGARWFTRAQPAPTISCNCVESLGAVEGYQQIKKKSEVLPPQAHPLGIGCPPTPSRQRLYGPKASGALHLSGALLRQDAKPKHQIIHGSVAGTLFEGPHGVPPSPPGRGRGGAMPHAPHLGRSRL